MFSVTWVVPADGGFDGFFGGGCGPFYDLAGRDFGGDIGWEGFDTHGLHEVIVSGEKPHRSDGEVLELRRWLLSTCGVGGSPGHEAGKLRVFWMRTRRLGWWALTSMDVSRRVRFSRRTSEASVREMMCFRPTRRRTPDGSAWLGRTGTGR